MRDLTELNRLLYADDAEPMALMVDRAHRKPGFVRGRELAHRAKEIRDSFDIIKDEETPK